MNLFGRYYYYYSTKVLLQYKYKDILQEISIIFCNRFHHHHVWPFAFPSFLLLLFVYHWLTRRNFYALSKHLKKILVIVLHVSFVPFYWLKWLLRRAFQNCTSFSKILIIAKVMMEKVKSSKYAPFSKDSFLRLRVITSSRT